MIDKTIYKKNKSNIYFTVLSALFFLCLSVYAIYSSISDPYLWYDEAGQFWISKGYIHGTTRQYLYHYYYLYLVSSTFIR